MPGIGTNGERVQPINVSVDREVHNQLVQHLRLRGITFSFWVRQKERQELERLRQHKEKRAVKAMG
jgi:hypothetical protein